MKGTALCVIWMWMCGFHVNVSKKRVDASWFSYRIEYNTSLLLGNYMLTQIPSDKVLADYHSFYVKKNSFVNLDKRTFSFQYDSHTKFELNLAYCRASTFTSFSIFLLFGLINSYHNCSIIINFQSRNNYQFIIVFFSVLSLSGRKNWCSLSGPFSCYS